MKRVMIVMGIMAISVFTYAQSHVVIDNGRGGDTYKVWVGTTPYELIPATSAGAKTCYTVKAMEGQYWFDYDSTVSTWNAVTYNAVGMRAGVKTGENAQIKVNEHITINGILGTPMYIVSDLTTGCTVQVIENTSYEQ